MAPLMVLPFRAQVYVYPLPVLPLSTTLPPEQKEVAPPAVIVFEGWLPTLMATEAEVAEQMPLLTTTVWAPFQKAV